MWMALEKYHQEGEEDELLSLTGLSPRLVPCRLFPTILESISSKYELYVINLATLTAQFQRICRIFRYDLDEKKRHLSEKEKANKPRSNWKAVEYPEWLLLELEMNMTIREIQVDIAKHMMDIEEGSKVTQLNMGEGKTSVILPMLIATLAKRMEECVRVTVLKSLFQTNYQQLKNTLGGMLGQMVHSLPCDRNTVLDSQKITTVLNLCKNIVEQKGVIVTVPEYRLSWELRTYESYKEGGIFCQNLIELFQWKESNCRDILDESDEILSPRYQKVYAMGASDKIKDIRWKTGQKILKKIPNILRELAAEFHDCIEIGEVAAEEKDKFPKCRLLNYTTESEKCFEKFAVVIAETFIKTELATVDVELQQLVLSYLTKSSFTRDQYLQLKGEDSLKVKFPMIEAMSEYLTHPGILKSALNKRWRVNYGVSGCDSRMAVPFKAKDVAYDKTEFGHPAMAIILTQLSYYYSGLTDEQIDDCLDKLEKRENPVVEFDEWIASTGLVEEISYKSLNRHFLPQRLKLFPALQFNTVVIDFYLTHCVFPKELKCYPGKIGTTAWDLAHSKNNNVAGFSGTNDAQSLLPLPVKQKDLEVLQETNDKVRKAVEKSNDYSALESWIPEGAEILKMMTMKKIKILIDAGALMIDMDNSQVADTMLELDENLEGVAFFDDNKLVVRGRKGKDADCDFAVSPLRESLCDKCAVYIDDEHTRGTDIKFPMGAVGCVTLGGRMPRDKLVQSCMRMRSLQSGEHTVAFIASKDADNQIKSMLGDERMENTPITAANVMAWVIKNSEEYEKEFLVFYANNALNFVKKRAGLMNFLSARDHARFGREVEELEKHGDEKEFASEEVFAHIISECFDSALLVRVESSLCSEEIRAMFINVKQHIVTLVNEKIEGKTCFSSSLEEQQEREIELEKEVQVQLTKPVVMHPHPHNMHQDVINFVLGVESCNLNGDGIKELEIPGIFASQDFLRVVQNGEILRPVNWLVSRVMGASGNRVCVLLSPFEVNNLILRFWRGEAEATLHMFSPRVRKGGHILLNIDNLQLGRKGCIIGGEMLGKLHLYACSLYFDEDEAQNVHKILSELRGSFNVVKHVEKRLHYFPENCDLRKLLNF